MERENFYILLDLPIDPPETDPKVIEAAISKKQAEWSRLRNHPTKGLQAQKYITLIPEIRRVMFDENLRAEEVRAATEYNLKDKEKKFPSIDRHIEVLMGKGHVTQEEVIKLSRIHKLSQGEIQKRINSKADEKFVKIDQQIGLRMAKGYVTELEIERLAKRHNLKASEVKARIHCPIRKNDKDNSIPPPRQLDRSIEKALGENLKIIGKTSLYDFLDLPEIAELDELKKASASKKKELANISRKDAELTAGNTLAGHCMTIFKNEETRNAYDISLAKSRLSELDSDIDISGLNGKIRAEYFQILVKKAMDFGMEQEEAERYIKDYCKRKNWSIERPRTGKRKFIVAGAVAIILVITASLLGTYYYYRHQAELRQTAYADLMTSVNQEKEPSKALSLLQQFVRKHQDTKAYSEFVSNAENKIKELNTRTAEAKHNSLMNQVSTLLKGNEYITAVDTLEKYLKGSPPKSFAQKADAEIKRIEKIIEVEDYKELSSILIEGRADEKIVAITDYMDRHPDGKHAENVKQMKNDLSNEYFIFVKNALENCEADEDWRTCSNLAEKYIELYDNSHSDQLSNRLDFFRKRIRENRLFFALKSKAEKKGDDYQGAIKIYEDYLAAYPEAAFRDQIIEEIESLNTRARKKAINTKYDHLRRFIEESNGRYIEKSDGVVMDTKTGLMWTLLDTGVTHPDECMTYELAQQYVKELTTGDYTDWRLPTADELAGIYKQEPFFPATKEKWYWSANNYSSYSDGWHHIVDTIDNSQDPESKVKRHDSYECGTVRAVRK